MRLIEENLKKSPRNTRSPSPISADEDIGDSEGISETRMWKIIDGALQILLSIQDQIFSKLEIDEYPQFLNSGAYQKHLAQLREQKQEKTKSHIETKGEDSGRQTSGVRRRFTLGSSYRSAVLLQNSRTSESPTRQNNNSLSLDVLDSLENSNEKTPKKTLKTERTYRSTDDLRSPTSPTKSREIPETNTPLSMRETELENPFVTPRLKKKLMMRSSVDMTQIMKDRNHVNDQYQLTSNLIGTDALKGEIAPPVTFRRRFPSQNLKQTRSAEDLLETRVLSVASDQIETIITDASPVSEYTDISTIPEFLSANRTNRRISRSQSPPAITLLNKNIEEENRRHSTDNEDKDKIQDRERSRSESPSKFRHFNVQSVFRRRSNREKVLNQSSTISSLESEADTNSTVSNSTGSNKNSLRLSGFKIRHQKTLSKSEEAKNTFVSKSISESSQKDSLHKKRSFLKRGSSPIKDRITEATTSNDSVFSPDFNSQNSPVEFQESKRSVTPIDMDDMSDAEEVNTPQVVSFKQRNQGSFRRKLKTMNMLLAGRKSEEIDPNELEELVEPEVPEKNTKNMKRFITLDVSGRRPRSNSGSAKVSDEKGIRWLTAFKSHISAESNLEHNISEDSEDENNEEQMLFDELELDLDNENNSDEFDVDEDGLVLTDDVSSDGLRLNLDEEMALEIDESASDDDGKIKENPNLPGDVLLGVNSHDLKAHTDIGRNFSDSDDYWPSVLGETPILSEVKIELDGLRKEDVEIEDQLKALAIELGENFENSLQGSISNSNGPQGSLHREIRRLKLQRLGIQAEIKRCEEKKHKIEDEELENVLTS
ncbi:hypothetical protein HK096_005221, partial [Nowakowskiella sp. JEL0078]